MSEQLSHSAAGITHVSIEVMAGDALMRGRTGSDTIEASLIGRGEVETIGDEVRIRGQVERAILPEGLDVRVDAVHGDLRVQALAGNAGLGRVDGDLRLDRLSGAIRLERAGGDVRAEGVNELHIDDRCDGDLRFIDGGALSLDALGGDLRVSGAGAVGIDTVHGDVWIEKLSGPLALSRAEGDVRLSDIAGPVQIGQVAGDLQTAGVLQGLTVGGTHGDAIVRGPFTGETGYTITADGDVSLHLSAVDDVRLTVRAAGRIRADVPLTPTADGTPTYSASVGSGATPVTVNAGGDLRIARAGGAQSGSAWERKRGAERDPLSDLSGLGERIRQQVAASMAAAGINLETGEINLRGRGERRGRPTPPPVPQPPAAPRPPRRSEGFTAEQMTILKMVEEGRITPEEADQLLKALGA